IDKGKCWPALALWQWCHEHEEIYHELTHGGNDIAHLAFRKAGLSFAMPTRIDRQGTRQFDFKGKLVFQDRKNDPWSLFLTNRSIPGFRFEKDCRKFLEELRRLCGIRPKSVLSFNGDRAGNKFIRESKLTELRPLDASLALKSNRRRRTPFTVLTLHDE